MYLKNLEAKLLGGDVGGGGGGGGGELSRQNVGESGRSRPGAKQVTGHFLCEP